jgi:hypothetical protein
VNRVLLFTCLALVLVVVAFVAVWMTLPSGHGVVAASSISYPARLFRFGTETTTTRTTQDSIRVCVDQRPRSYNDPSEPDQNPNRYSNLRPGNHCVRSVIRTPAVLTTYHWVDPQKMKNHALVFFGGLAAVVLLLGIALGAASRRNVPPSAEVVPPRG